jgi:hypothetical protein
MVKCILSCLIILSIGLLPRGEINADVIINEVLSNEPGGNVSLEWLEIYNTTSATKPLAFYRLIVRTDTLLMPLYGLDPFGYAVLCRDIGAFEIAWGDSSGEWGDNETKEFYPAFELPGLQLRNDTCFAKLIQFSDSVSYFEWTEPGPDGVSWERIFPDSAVSGSSIDPSGSTPGRMNSITPREYDLALLPVEVWLEPPGLSGFEITIANIGLYFVGMGILSMYYDFDGDSLADSSDLIAIIDYPETFRGDTLTIIAYLELDSIYPDVLFELPPDDQMSNNRRLVQAFGREYPPVVISEFLADPTTDSDAEWVELKNRSGINIDLEGWYLGDEKIFHPIVSQAHLLDAGQYVVLCKDSTALTAIYGLFDFDIIDMSSWAILNNDKDIIRLRDNYGFVVDSLRYDFAYGDNYTWARGEEAGKSDRWGRSVDVGGTPGSMNEVYLQTQASSITVTVDPNPFSPSIDREMEIAFSLPAGDNLKLKIYDLNGRVVKTIIDDVPAYEGSVLWDGKSDGGRPLNVGMYILYLEVSGVDQYKQTIVIAP